MTAFSHYPRYVSDLIALYDHSPRKLLGSGVFYDLLEPEANLEQVALRRQREFVGDKFYTPKEKDWLRGWHLLYRRPEGQAGNIVKEFESVYDICEKIWEKFLNPLGQNDSKTAPQELAIAFNDPQVTDLRIYQIHDQDILNGRLIISRRSNGETTTLIFLYD
ncbi:hypothetical protein QPK87_12685 [Kamptonema cortianum]|uniref:Uncharacterized protein n=1 Tax=Geitlerinema calcuttense NRMC-F 0142 TaxID=2922238 RepID=A0ABT7LYB9_9CYAN|nr:hypothetical protein [Geitlerinema calcuttense]MDK3157424.1 hypothetical protein [Kamptonema cortianum]MDL5057009.1 hypothetical protein [Geitlerinema calcuttense NRMC-F 0142]